MYENGVGQNIIVKVLALHLNKITIDAADPEIVFFYSMHSSFCPNIVPTLPIMQHHR